jgi:hemoglobin-like flavoprotein
LRCRHKQFAQTYRPIRHWALPGGWRSGASTSVAALGIGGRLNAADNARATLTHNLVNVVMEMAPGDVELVQQSFALVRCVGATAANLFYQRLFELDPAARELFPGDLKVQRVQFLATLHFFIQSLEQPQALLAFGQRLQPGQDALGLLSLEGDAAGQALLWMLRRVLGPGFTPEVRQAWQQAVATIQAIRVE